MKRYLIPGIILVNAGAAYYLTRVHQSGVISVMHHLRNDIPQNGSVGFLMPCYSTPWQVYLQRSDVDAWKLSCDPPLTYLHTINYLNEDCQRKNERRILMKRIGFTPTLKDTLIP
jgi:hypothetical protein